MLYNQFLIYLGILTRKYTQLYSYSELQCFVCVEEEARTKNYNIRKWILCIVTLQL